MTAVRRESNGIRMMGVGLYIIPFTFPSYMASDIDVRSPDTSGGFRVHAAQRLGPRRVKPLNLFGHPVGESVASDGIEQPAEPVAPDSGVERGLVRHGGRQRNPHSTGALLPFGRSAA